MTCPTSHLLQPFAPNHLPGAQRISLIEDRAKRQPGTRSIVASCEGVCAAPAHPYRRFHLCDDQRKSFAKEPKALYARLRGVSSRCLGSAHDHCCQRYTRRVAATTATGIGVSTTWEDSRRKAVPLNWSRGGAHAPVLVCPNCLYLAFGLSQSPRNSKAHALPNRECIQCVSTPTTTSAPNRQAAISS